MKNSIFLSSALCAALAGSPLFAAGERRPFPQHTAYTAGTIKPSRQPQSVLDGELLAFYRAWKQKYLRPAAPGELYVAANAEGTMDNPRGRSISEGHGYGMLATVLMAGADPEAHADFDALYRFFRAHPTQAQPALMAWRQIARPGSETLTERPDDKDSATDGDLDIAAALLLADRQWGSEGGIDYKAEALRTAASILAGETDPARQTLTLGNWVKEDKKYRGSLRSSDFIPGHLKAFAAASGDTRWTGIVNRTYEILGEVTAAYSPETGLFPDFILLKEGKYAPAPKRFLESKNDGSYAYNACRVPWRLGVDYLLHGDRRARLLLEPLNAWIQTATGGDPKRINAGYRLDGHRLAEDQSAAFTGPFTVAAMIDARNQAWLDALWSRLLNRPLEKETYYGNTLKLLTLIVLTGNWWE